MPLILWMTWRHGRREGEPGYLQARLGYGASTPGGAIWLHAASVGEVNAAMPLLAALASSYPNRPLLLSTATASGARIARNKLPAEAQHVFLPLDFPFAVRRFLDRHRPSCALIMETELWPNLYQACAASQIPLLIINGRLSKRTLGSGRWLRRLYRHTLAHSTMVLARSEADAQGFRELGAARCEVIGNIKFDAAPRAETISPLDLGRPYVLAASTREGEEILLLKAWRRLRDEGMELPLLVIAPRHPQRREAILRDLAAENLALRSRQEEITADTTIYLADTFGELSMLMAGAEWVFVGGSLVNKGGQNLLEPAALGKAVLFGPHMDNFRDETRILLEAGGAQQVADVDELVEAMDGLLHNPKRAEQMGIKARQQIELRSDMAERYLLAVDRYISKGQGSKG
jgi:3-deoxy-D-manno-octulosonic-acid transferase